jgi:histidinol phosphatase-like PHP family hydrolase
MILPRHRGKGVRHNMRLTISRRNFLSTVGAAGTLFTAPCCLRAWAEDAHASNDLGFPLIDFHAHIEGSLTLESALELARQRGVKLGIAEHGGCHEAMKNDDDMKRYIDRLSGQPVFKGMQAEGHNWMQCFSKEVVAQLDFVLADALTFPEKDGHPVRLWTPEAQITDPQDFMERYVEFNVQVISREPIDIFANPTFLPRAIAKEYDALWTKARMRKVIDAAVNYGVAIEINSRYNIPSLAFLRMAKDAGVKFSFGSNAHDDRVGILDYSVKMAKGLGLTASDMFMPAPFDRKPILIRTLPVGHG